MMFLINQDGGEFSNHLTANSEADKNFCNTSSVRRITCAGDDKKSTS